MNHEQWTDFLTAAQGHKKNLLGDCDPEGMASIAFCAGWTDADVSLAAAAPDLLAEVARLRGWMEEIESHVVYGGLAAEQIQDALNGAEVPK